MFKRFCNGSESNTNSSLGIVRIKFYQIHLLTGDIQTEMGGIDNIAEHIRSINVMTPASVVDLIQNKRY